MADAFEQDLILLLDEPRPLEGEDAFAAAIEARIERTWRIRRWGIGVAAAAGIGVTVASLWRAQLGLGALERLSSSLAAASGAGLQADDLTWLAAAGLIALGAVILPRLFEES